MPVYLLLSYNGTNYYYLSNQVNWINNNYPVSQLYHNQIGIGCGNEKTHSVSDTLFTTTTHRPIFSVIMTVYNCSKYLYVSIPSVLNQTIKDLELIIINDNSADNSDEIIRDYMRKDNRIRYIKNEANMGCYISKNMGIQIANGQWLAFQDSDDYSGSDRLEKQLEFCNMYNLEACYCSFLSRLVKQFTVVEIGLVVNKDVFDDKLGFFDSVRFGADTELRKRMDKIKIKYKVMNVPLYHCVDRYVEINGRNNSLTNSLNTNSNSEIRKKYKYSFDVFHLQTTDGRVLKYKFPQKNRPFQIIGITSEEKTIIYGENSIL